MRDAAAGDARRGRGWHTLALPEGRGKTRRRLVQILQLWRELHVFPADGSLVAQHVTACLLSACAGCAPDDGAGGGAAGAPPLRVVLGTGEAEFEPMEGEPQLRLVAGVQGGFHAWASLLAYGFSAERPEMVLETRVDDDTASSLVMRARLLLRETIDADGNPARAFAGFPAQVAGARCADGKRVSVHVTLLEPAGGSAEDTRAYFADLDPSQQRDDCE